MTPRGHWGKTVAATLLLLACGSRTDPFDAAARGTEGDSGGSTCEPCPEAILTGDAVIFSQADVDALAQYTEITGRLELGENNGITNLDGLSCLASVGKSLVVEASPSLETVQGFVCLETVGGSFQIQDSAGLGDLDGLERLTDIGVDLLLNNMQSLSDVSGLRGLRKLGRNLGVNTAPNLPTCDAYGIAGHLVEFGGMATIRGTLPDACGP